MGVLSARFGVDEHTVMHAINSATKLDGKLPSRGNAGRPCPTRPFEGYRKIAC